MRSAILALCSLACSTLYAQAPIQLKVDASDAPRRLFHVRMSMPANPGPLTLMYPEWIPGEHGPTGPIANFVGLRIEGAGKTIPWRRDDVNMYAFHLDVPSGVSTLEIAFDFISPPESDGFTSGASTTTELAVLNWNQVLLYPQGAQSDTLSYQATLKVPAGWRYGTALPIQRESGNEIEFRPAPMTTLVDSPVSAGAHYKTFDLGNENGAEHYLHVAADSDRALEAPPEVVAGFRHLVNEAGALFGARHFRDYHFLYTLSDHVAHFGLEHHESSDDRTGERSLIDPDMLKSHAYLLPHEFVHSWNGKYRRPLGLTPGGGRDGGYDTPMKGGLLWVYEGLTNYLGEVLAARSGLWKPEDYRESLANTAAALDHTFGRTWRPLEDTAVAAQTLYDAGSDYETLRRSVDYYPEGSLIWLEADTIIRQLSKGTKSIDDFCRAFHGGANSGPALKTYEFADVVSALNAVQPYDWAGFLNQRIRSTDVHAPLGGIARSGWKLVYDNVISDFWKANEEERKTTNLMYSIGISVREDGSIADVLYGGPAQKAGVAPAVKLIAVNGRQYTPTVLREAVAAKQPVELLVRNGEFYRTHRVDYTGGERYPHLVREEGSPDLLTGIISAKAKR
ncbi:MAG: M61 family metallopeptidase [Acidobacteria bacterium]|nr:M61 family metallopeptidase [Acidobacteriota bacterium]